MKAKMESMFNITYWDRKLKIWVREKTNFTDVIEQVRRQTWSWLLSRIWDDQWTSRITPGHLTKWNDLEEGRWDGGETNLTYVQQRLVKTCIETAHWGLAHDHSMMMIMKHILFACMTLYGVWPSRWVERGWVGGAVLWHWHVASCHHVSQQTLVGALRVRPFCRKRGFPAAVHTQQ